MSERLLALASGVHDGNPPEVSPPDMVRIAADPATTAWVSGSHREITGTAVPPAALRASKQGLSHSMSRSSGCNRGKPDPATYCHGRRGGRQKLLIVSSEPDRDTTKHLDDLCLHAERAGMRACLEYAITEGKTLDDALDVVNAVDHPAGDSGAFIMNADTPPENQEIPERWLSYAQLCDMPERGVITDADEYFANAIDGRLAPGEGSIPLSVRPGLTQ